MSTRKPPELNTEIPATITKPVNYHFKMISFVFVLGCLQWQFVCLSHHLCGLFQVQPGLTDNSLGVLQLRLELTVFSGDLLEHLRHRGTHTNKHGSKQLGQIRRTNAVTSISLTFLKSLLSEPPPWMQSLKEMSDLRRGAEVRDTAITDIDFPSFSPWAAAQTSQRPNSYLELERLTVCKQRRQANKL